MSSELPSTRLQESSVVDDVTTDFVITEFEDNYLIVVSQYGKLGTLVRVSQHRISDEHFRVNVVYDTKVLLGKDEPETHAIAKTICETLKFKKPIILGLALKSTSMSSVKGVIQQLNNFTSHL